MSKTGIFDFTSIGLYAGFGTGGLLLEAGTIVPRMGGTALTYLAPHMVDDGRYTIAYSGKVTGKPARVGSSVTFALTIIPEPSSWLLMVAGFGLVGLSGLRRRGVLGSASPS